MRWVFMPIDLYKKNLSIFLRLLVFFSTGFVLFFLNCVSTMTKWCFSKVENFFQVLEKDLAIFGFFIALGRSTQYFLSENGFSSTEEPVEEIIRYSFLSCSFMYWFLLYFYIIGIVDLICCYSPQTGILLVAVCYIIRNLHQ